MTHYFCVEFDCDIGQPYYVTIDGQENCVKSGERARFMLTDSAKISLSRYSLGDERKPKTVRAVIISTEGRFELSTERRHGPLVVCFVRMNGGLMPVLKSRGPVKFYYDLFPIEPIRPSPSPRALEWPLCHLADVPPMKIVGIDLVPTVSNDALSSHITNLFLRAPLHPETLTKLTGSHIRMPLAWWQEKEEEIRKARK